MTSILNLIGTNFQQYVTALAEASELLNGDLDSSAKKKVREMVARLQSDKVSYSLLDRAQRQCLEEVLTLHDELVGVNFIFDEHPADNGNKRTQIDWISWWNQQSDDKVMASMGDLYRGFKQLKEMYGHGDRVKAEGIRSHLQQNDFDWPKQQKWLISSTRPIYSGNDLSARIVHHYGCKSTELVTEYYLDIFPVYCGTEIEKVVSEVDGLKGLQAVLDTVDSAEDIMQNLEFISGKNRRQITFWTAAEKGSYDRKSYPKRAAGFDCGGDVFHVCASVIIDGIPGCSRGVERSVAGAR